MEKGNLMTENALIILGVLGLFAVLAIAAIALVYNRGLSIKVSDTSVEVKTQSSSEMVESSQNSMANNPDSSISR